MDLEHLATLERLRQNQRQDYLKGSVCGSVQATDRLMKELRDIYRSDSFKKGMLLIMRLPRIFTLNIYIKRFLRVIVVSYSIANKYVS